MKVVINAHIAQLPQIKFPPSFWNKTAEVVSAGIVDNITGQKQADGQRIKQNAASTRRRKSLAGRALKSLIDVFHRFVQGGFGSWGPVTMDERHLVIGPMTAELSDLSEAVQIKGYVGWMGMSRKTRAAVVALVNQHCKKVLAAAGKSMGKRGK